MNGLVAKRGAALSELPGISDTAIAEPAHHHAYSRKRRRSIDDAIASGPLITPP